MIRYNPRPSTNVSVKYSDSFFGVNFRNKKTQYLCSRRSVTSVQFGPSLYTVYCHFTKIMMYAVSCVSSADSLNLRTHPRESRTSHWYSWLLQQVGRLNFTALSCTRTRFVSIFSCRWYNYNPWSPYILAREPYVLGFIFECSLLGPR